MVDRSSVISTVERIKGAAMILIGLVIIYMAADNYLKVANMQIGAVLNLPRIISWAYDTIGPTPSFILQALLGAALAAYGGYKAVKGV